MLRLFGITGQERGVRVDDFHVPADETSAPGTRELTIEAVLAFPELEEEADEEPGDAGEAGTAAEAGETGAVSGLGSGLVSGSGYRAVPEFFQRMTATEDGELKVRIVLKAEWADDGTVDGAVTETRIVVATLAEVYGEGDFVVLPPAERSRIQMIYIPASRDGARQVTAFMRSRLWRAAQWSTGLRELVSEHASEVADRFTAEPVVTAVESALTVRWRELHDAGTHTDPRLRLLDGDFDQLVRNSELVFEPDHSGRPRPARQLSDGQRSLLHLALTAAALDVEAAVSDGRYDQDFTLDATRLPNLTLIAVEEPENSLSPFFLSRIVTQLATLSGAEATQSVLSSHSASVMSRIRPEAVRYFRGDAGASAVREITLPPGLSEAGLYMREAVRAHPELYFATFVVLGEGDTEQLVIPRIAQAHGVALDPSFVAMVPLGGRHTNHMWRLLNDLDIPHATLLDLDYGKAGAGPARLRDACTRLVNSGLTPLAGLAGYRDITEIADITDALTLEELAPILVHLRSFGVFFAEPLDLDYAMLEQFEAAYTRLEPEDRGPHTSDPTTTVLGDAGTRADFWAADDRLARLRWYRYLFLTRSKPSTHLQALARLRDADLAAHTPEVLTALVAHIRDKAGL